MLYGTLTIFLDQPATLHACVRAAGTFVAIFAGSMVIGVGFALLASLAVKSKYFRSDDTPLESILVVLFAYGSYMLADGLKLSGIVAILFSGMVRWGRHAARICNLPPRCCCCQVMAHYTRPSLSRVARDRTTSFVKTLATLAETFVFIYIGLSLFLEQQAWDRGLTWAFLVRGGGHGHTQACKNTCGIATSACCFFHLLSYFHTHNFDTRESLLVPAHITPQQAISLVALAISRAVNVYPCTALVNALRTPETRVPPRHSFMLWFSGLRGAMAFALSLQAAEDLPGAPCCSAWSTVWLCVVCCMVVGGVDQVPNHCEHVHQQQHVCMATTCVSHRDSLHSRCR